MVAAEKQHCISLARRSQYGVVLTDQLMDWLWLPLRNDSASHWRGGFNMVLPARLNT
jgi:hypothetical protein